MNISLPELREVMYFLADVQPIEDRLASPMVEVEMVGSLATRVSRVTDLHSPEWQEDLLPRIIELAQQVLPRYPWMIPNCCFDKWGLSPIQKRDLIRGIFKRVSPKEIDYTEEETQEAFFSLLFQVNPPSRPFLASAMLILIHKVLFRKIDSLGFSEKDRLKFALEGVAFKFEAVSANMRRLGITSMEDRFQVAKTGLSSRCAFATYVSEYLDEYELDEAKHLELASLAAANATSSFFKSFRNYRIPKEADRVAIVKSVLPEKSEEVWKYFHNFNIQDPTALFEIGQLFTPKVLEEAILQIRWSDEQRFELLDRAAQKSVEIRDAIHKHSVPKKEHRVRLFERLLAHGKKFFSLRETLIRWGIQDRETLLLLAEKHARFPTFCQNVKVYQIKRVHDLLRLAKINAAAGYLLPYYFWTDFNVPEEFATSLWPIHIIVHPDCIKGEPPPYAEIADKIAQENDYLTKKEKPLPYKTTVLIQARIKILNHYHNFSPEQLQALDQLALAIHETWPAEEQEDLSKFICLHFLEKEHFDTWYQSLPRSPEGTVLKDHLIPSACAALFSSKTYGEWMRDLQQKGKLFREWKQG